MSLFIWRYIFPDRLQLSLSAICSSQFPHSGYFITSGLRLASDTRLFCYMNKTSITLLSNRFPMSFCEEVKIASFLHKRVQYVSSTAVQYYHFLWKIVVLWDGVRGCPHGAGALNNSLGPGGHLLSHQHSWGSDCSPQLPRHMSPLIAVWGKKAVYSPRATDRPEERWSEPLRPSTSLYYRWGTISPALMKSTTCTVSIWEEESINQVFIFLNGHSSESRTTQKPCIIYLYMRNIESEAHFDLDLIFSLTLASCTILRVVDSSRSGFSGERRTWLFSISSIKTSTNFV